MRARNTNSTAQSVRRAARGDKALGRHALADTQVGLPRSRSCAGCCGCTSRARGFSLLEVIAAVLLLAITFASLMRVAGSSLNLTARSAERSEAAMWAHNLLDSAFVFQPIRAGRSSGRFDQRYSWRLNVQPYQPAPVAPMAGPQPLAPASPLRLYRLDLDVLWKSAGHDYSARFSTLRVGGPQPSVASGS